MEEVKLKIAEWEKFYYDYGKNPWDWKCTACGNIQEFKTRKCKKCQADMGDGIEEHRKVEINET